MDALTQAEVFALIGELNGFIEKWDPRLVTQEREYQAKRTRIIAENNAEKTRREKAYKQECETLSRQSAKMIEDAQKILEDVDQMDQQLMLFRLQGRSLICLQKSYVSSTAIIADRSQAITRLPSTAFITMQQRMRRMCEGRVLHTTTNWDT